MRSLALSLSIACVALPSVVRAQGFGVYEQGACAMGRAGAAAGEPCDDGSAIFLNPAGLAGHAGILITGGGTAVYGSGSFTSDQGTKTKLDNDIVIPPHVYFQYGLNDRLAFGVGLYAPYGLEVRWPLEFEGRFVSYDSRLKTLYIQPTVAYAINDRISIGGGLTVLASSVDLSRREDLAEVPLAPVPGLTFGALLDTGTDFATTALSAGWAKGVGANLGVLLKAHERVRLGARYLTGVTLKYDGDATFTPVPGRFVVTKPNALGLPVGTPLDPFVAQVLGALQNQQVHTELEMPAQFVIGVSVHAAPRLKLLADYQWVDWSAFGSIRLEFANPVPPDEELVQNYRDTGTVRFGAEVALTPSVRVSGGYIYNQAAAPDETVTPILPEANRNHLTMGLGWTVHRHWTIDTAYQFVHSADRRGRVVNPPPGALPSTALNTGVYSTRADLFAVTATFRR